VNKLTLLLACTLLISLANTSLAKDWRGIIPLHSSKADVIRLLGQPSDDENSHDTSNGKVIVLYSRKPCDRLFGIERWAVPADTVLQITVALKGLVLLKDLHLDLSKYKLEPADHGQGSYRNDDEGVSYNLWMGNLVSSITYGPAKRDAHLLCREEPRSISRSLTTHSTGMQISVALMRETSFVSVPG